MFNKEIENESMDIDLEKDNPFNKYGTIQEALTESIIESYEDLIRFNEFTSRADAKEAELIINHESEDVLTTYTESVGAKAKGYVKTLGQKVIARYKQFVAFVNRKIASAITKAAAKYVKKANENYAAAKAAGKEMPKIKFPKAAKDPSSYASQIVSMTSAGIANIGKNNGNKAEFNASLGEMEEAPLNPTMWKGIDALAAAITKLGEVGTKKIEEAIKAASGGDASKQKGAAANISKIGASARILLAQAAKLLRRFAGASLHAAAKAASLSTKADKKDKDKDKGKDEKASNESFDLSSLDLSVDVLG